MCRRPQQTHKIYASFAREFHIRDNHTLDLVLPAAMCTCTNDYSQLLPRPCRTTPTSCCSAHHAVRDAASVRDCLRAGVGRRQSVRFDPHVAALPCDHQERRVRLGLRATEHVHGKHGKASLLHVVAAKRRVKPLRLWLGC